MLIPVAVAIAILRYRLYEIDRVISRTLVYGLLTVVLGAAYVALVLAGQAVFSSFAGGSNLAIAGSTLVVAALFLPLRGRVQRLVDRRFYRRRYDAQRTLAAFGTRLREQVDLDGLRGDLEAVVAETVQPAHVSLWLARARGREAAVDVVARVGRLAAHAGALRGSRSRSSQTSATRSARSRTPGPRGSRCSSRSSPSRPSAR